MYLIILININNIASRGKQVLLAWMGLVKNSEEVCESGQKSMQERVGQIF